MQVGNCRVLDDASSPQRSVLGWQTYSCGDSRNNAYPGWTSTTCRPPGSIFSHDRRRRISHARLETGPTARQVRRVVYSGNGDRHYRADPSCARSVAYLVGSTVPETPLARGGPHVDAARSSPLTSCPGRPLMRRRQLPFHVRCSDQHLGTVTRSPVAVSGVTTSQSSWGSWWACQEACPGPSHLGQDAFQKQKILEIESLNFVS